MSIGISRAFTRNSKCANALVAALFADKRSFQPIPIGIMLPFTLTFSYSGKIILFSKYANGNPQQGLEYNMEKFF